MVSLSVLTAVACTSCAAGSVEPPGASSTPSSSASPRATPSASAPEPTPEPSSTPAGFDRARFSLDDPTSIWVVSNKLRPLDPIDFVPTDLVDTPVSSQNPPALRAEAAEALTSMFETAAAEGAGAMTLQSAYRSYDTQVRVYDGFVARLGQNAADRTSARPGHSEHQTGLAADISPLPLSCVLQACFGETAQGVWLAENSWRFGFLLRYPADKIAVTGFDYEPWHFRYIGVDLATELRETGVTTLEEFFGLPAAPDYG